nr:hypothetical protein [Tanacetum cinerariifolium]
MHKSKSFNKLPANKTLYHALIESLIAYENDIDQGVAKLIKHKKRPHDDDDRDHDPPAGPDQGLKKMKTSKDVKPSKKPKSTGSSKDTTQSQPKLTGNTDEQPNVEATPKQDWFKKSARPPTLDPEWNTRKSVDDGPT